MNIYEVVTGSIFNRSRCNSGFDAFALCGAGCIHRFGIIHL